MRTSSAGKLKSRRDEFTNLEELPNIGPAMAHDFALMGITSPGQLCGKDPYQIYDDLCRITGHRHDPCVLDTFIAAVDFMNGAPAKPWWKYTAERKRDWSSRKK